MTNSWIDELFRRLQELNPKPETELLYTNPYTLLVAVVLSAQATDKGVNKATAELFKVADTPEKMVNLGEERLSGYLKTLNLYKTKTRNVIGLSRILLERYKGQIPKDREALESLPGVGRKTANVVLNVAFGKETIAVDTHIFRVANRTGLAVGKTPLDVEKVLEKVIPKEFRLHAHHWLILHGRYICTAKNPKCEVCPISDLCQYFKSKI
ncbi:MAG: endonuclease III [Alphaproteobacteria bacterium]|nr:endonuclease III [Alphaproteobacteria bacterium]